MMDENCPFVLELEIDDEISFKPMSRGRALQALDCNAVPTPDRSPQREASTPCTTPRKSFMSRLTSPRINKETKIQQSAKRGLMNSEYLAAIVEPSPCSNPLPTSTVKSSQKIHSLLSRLTPSRLKSTPKRKDTQPPLKKPSPPHISVNKSLFAEGETDSDSVGVDTTTSVGNICYETISEETMTAFPKSAENSSEFPVEDKTTVGNISVEVPLVEDADCAAVKDTIRVVETNPFAQDIRCSIAAFTDCFSDTEMAADSIETDTKLSDVVQSTIKPQVTVPEEPCAMDINLQGPVGELTTVQNMITTVHLQSVPHRVCASQPELMSATELVSEGGLDKTVNSTDEKASENKRTQNPRRVSTALALHDEYLEDLHMPQYSQAEMDTARVAWTKETNQEVAKQVSLAVQEVRVALDDKSGQLYAARETIAALQEEISGLQQQKCESQNDRREVISLDMKLKELANQNTSLEEQLSTQRTIHLKEMDKLRVEHDQYVLHVMANDAQTLSDATNAITEKYEKMLSDEREVSTRHLQVLVETKERVVALETEMPLAIQEAKRKVYEKAQAQFATGNKEFQKIKSNLRDALCAKEEVDKKIASLELSLQNMSTQLSTTEAEKEKINADMLSITSRLEVIVRADAGILYDKRLPPLEAVGAVLTYYREKSGEYTHLLSKAQDEKSEQEAIIQDLKEQLSSTQLTAKELQEALSVVEKRAESVTEALNSSKRENQNQLVLTANVMSEKGRIESALTSSKNDLESSLLKQAELRSQLEEAQGKVEELTTRCEELRAMNKEVIEMLEAMYTKEGHGAL